MYGSSDFLALVVAWSLAALAAWAIRRGRMK